MNPPTSAVKTKVVNGCENLVVSPRKSHNSIKRTNDVTLPKCPLRVRRHFTTGGVRRAPDGGVVAERICVVSFLDCNVVSMVD